MFRFLTVVLAIFVIESTHSEACILRRIKLRLNRGFVSEEGPHRSYYEYDGRSRRLVMETWTGSGWTVRRFPWEPHYERRGPNE